MMTVIAQISNWEATTAQGRPPKVVQERDGWNGWIVVPRRPWSRFNTGLAEKKYPQEHLQAGIGGRIALS